MLPCSPVGDGFEFLLPAVHMHACAAESAGAASGAGFGALEGRVWIFGSVCCFGLSVRVQLVAEPAEVEKLSVVDFN